MRGAGHAPARTTQKVSRQAVGRGVGKRLNAHAYLCSCAMRSHIVRRSVRLLGSMRRGLMCVTRPRCAQTVSTASACAAFRSIIGWELSYEK